MVAEHRKPLLTAISDTSLGVHPTYRDKQLPKWLGAAKAL